MPGRPIMRNNPVRQLERFTKAISRSTKDKTLTEQALARIAGVSVQQFRAMRRQLYANLGAEGTAEEMFAQRHDLVQSHTATIQDMEECLDGNHLVDQKLSEWMQSKDPEVSLEP